MVVTAAVWALFVCIALWPPVRSGRLGFAVFLLTMAVNEIPLVLLTVFVVAMGVSDHRVGTPVMGVSAVLVGMTAGGLIWLQGRARSASTALEAALVDGLGAGPAVCVTVTGAGVVGAGVVGRGVDDGVGAGFRVAVGAGVGLLGVGSGACVRVGSGAGVAGRVGAAVGAAGPEST